MRLIFIFAFIFTSTIAQAKICTKDALAAKAQGVNHLVISFEGLMSYNAGFVRKTLIKNLQSKFRFYSKNLSYTSTAKAVECLNDWENVFKSNYQLSVIGHSFGGGIATFKFLELIKHTHVDNVMTLDPRSWSTDSQYSKTKSLYQFKKPQNVDQFVNFYQRGGMPGYRVQGAQNQELKNTKHTKVPAHPHVEVSARCLLFGAC